MGSRRSSIRSLGWFDEHGPRATMQITPDGDYTQTGVAWNKFGYANPHLHQYVEAPERSGSVLLPCPDGQGGRVCVSLDRRAGDSRPRRRRAGLEHHLERLQQLRRPEQLHQPRPAAADAHGQRPARAQAVHRPGRRHLRHRRLRAAVVRPSRADQPHRLRTPRSPTRSRAGPPATSRRPSGGSWAGSSASTSPTTITPRPSSTTARSTSMPTRC